VLLADGVNAIDINQKQTKQNIIKKSDDWGSVSTIVSFGGNIYLLDTVKSRIWKYVATEIGFSEIREYLNPDTLPDLSKSTGMVIDGSVWLGTNEGKILRFTQGKENAFASKGVDPAFGTKLVVYTSDETNNLYVLDGENKRVVVLDKDGMYLSQYVWKSDSLFTNLVVSEKHGKILLLGNDKVYSLDIK
jgi:sugar lactone lactonase YvrE